MKKLAIATIVAAVFSPAAFASKDLAEKKNCLACHQSEQKLVGPSYKEVAAKYAGQKDAAAKLADKIQKGGTGVWGQIPMPANPQVNADEAKALATWILTVK